jgi:hypothetical protein
VRTVQVKSMPVCDWWPNTPRELATVSKEDWSVKKPAATSPFFLQASMLYAATCARYSGLMASVDLLNVSERLKACLSGVGMNSGFSGASFASSSARCTALASDLSSNSLMTAVPCFLPNATATDNWVFSTRPAVDTALRA